MAEHHLDRRQVLRAMLLGAAGLAVPAACGLPSGGHPIVDGPASTAVPGSGDALTKAPTPDAALDAPGLVSAFFGAVAGRIHGDLTEANQRALRFLTASARATWPKPGSGITVVRLDSNMPTSFGGGATLVDVSLKPTGVLGLDGTVGPPGDTTWRKLRFTVRQTAESGRPGGYLIDAINPVGDSPGLSGMMLDSALLDGELFSPQLIYFWSTDRSGLVPDLRYVPKAGVSREIQYTEVVGWVLQGASDFLRDAVQPNPLAQNSLVVPNVVAPDRNGLLVNLANPLPQVLTTDQLMAQLRWSLRPLYEDTVRLQINSQPQQVEGSNNDFRRANPADQDELPNESEFCVAGGVARPVNDPTNPPPVLNNPENKDVVLAAVSRDLKAAAFVKYDVKSDYRLHIGESQSQPFAVATSGQVLSGPVSAWTRPAFLPGNRHRVMVGLYGRLYVVGTDGQAKPLATPGSVSAMSVSPDGHRVALISGGAAWVYALKVNGDDISLGIQGQARAIDAGLVNCTDIAWSRLDRVLIAGKLPDKDAYRLVESTVDGAIVTEFGVVFSTQIQSLVALPLPVWQPASSAEVALVQTGNDARRVGASSNSAVTFTWSPGTSPAPSPSGAGSALGTPASPFYAG
jgi:hypothetical protein